MSNNRTFKLHLKNSRDKKDIHTFSKALLAMSEFAGQQQGSKYLYMHVSKEGKVSIGSAIQNIWDTTTTNLQNGSFFLKFKDSVIKIADKNFDEIIVCIPLKQIQSFFDQKVEAKMTNITLVFEKFRVIGNFQTNQFFKGHMETNYFNFRGQYNDNPHQDAKWPVCPQVFQPNEYKKIIKLFVLPPQSGKHIQVSNNIYIKFQDSRLLFQSQSDGSIWTTKLKSQQVKEYDYQTIKKEFQNKLYLSIQSPNFVRHIKHCAKNKMLCEFKVILFMNKIDPTKISRSHLVLESSSDKSEQMYKIFLVYLRDDLDSQKQQQKQIEIMNEIEPKNQGYRKLVINRYKNDNQNFKYHTQQKLNLKRETFNEKIEYKEQTIKKSYVEHTLF